MTPLSGEQVCDDIELAETTWLAGRATMIVSQELGCLFVHIWKTGGSSITAALAPHLGIEPEPWWFEAGAAYWQPRVHTTGMMHSPYEAAEPLLSPELLSRLFKFSFVRNPWDLWVSYYSFLRNVSQANRPTPIMRVAHRLDSFTDFIRGLKALPELAKWRSRTQVEFLSDSQGILAMDFIGRFERLTEDWAVVQQRLGIIAELFTQDVEHFGYFFSEDGVAESS